MKASIVIPNFNGEALLKKNLEQVVKAGLIEKAEIIIVDDCSTDKSINYLKRAKEKYGVRLVVNKKNRGFGYSCNRGVRAAEGEVVVLLNNDVYPEKDFLRLLLPYFKDGRVFAVGCREKNGKERGRAVGKFERGFLVHKRAKNQNKNDTLWVAGGSGAFRKRIFEKLGGFDEIYKPFYWEDIDLSYRALKLGYKVLFEPRSIVYHRHESTIGRFFDKMEIREISIRNSFIFVWKNISDWDFILNHIFWLPMNLMMAGLRFDKGFLAGFVKALTLLPKIRRTSGVKSDREILERLKDE